ncbi:hypothetical protein D917_01376 [Trichinella nativa]|uniref:Uncharacterized protein n=1 Tax=Trichinella nativa TaxID=6335 RepID=A0A1Y3ER18_9BILA|nr:hypothetical protein D917_01376 [Trichinella nativa]
MEPGGKDTQMKQLRSMEIRKKNQNGIIYESVAMEKGTAFKTSHLGTISCGAQMKLILQIRRARRMSDVRDENKAPNTNQVNHAAKGNVQALLVKKEKNRK